MAAGGPARLAAVLPEVSELQVRQQHIKGKEGFLALKQCLTVHTSARLRASSDPFNAISASAASFIALTFAASASPRSRIAIAFAAVAQAGSWTVLQRHGRCCPLRP